MTKNPISFLPGEVEILHSKRFISTAKFAEKDFILVTGTFAHQPFNHDFAPYARGIMDIWDKPYVHEVIVAGASQTVKTTIAYVCLCSEIWRDPGPAAVCMPGKDTAKRIVDEKLGPHFLRSPKLRGLLSNGEDSIQSMRIVLRSGRVYIMYSGSEASMSSATIRVMVIDEEDANEDKTSVDTEKERTISYPLDRKIFRVSKPRGSEKDSTIWRDLSNRAQVVYQLRAVCPLCGHAQVMDDKRIRVPKGERDPAKIRHQKLAYYECEGCGGHWNDYTRNLAVAAGTWWSENEPERPECVAFHIPSWISRYVSLSDVAADWFSAINDGTPKALEQYDNNHKAMPYKVVAVETDESRVRKMLDPMLPPMIVPPEAVALTCGIDMQMNGFWFVVRAWGRQLQSWLIQYGWLNNFDEVEELIFKTRFPVAGRDDVVMPIWRAPIDIGGGRDDSSSEGWSKTDEVKAWLYNIENYYRPDVYPGVVYAIKGASRRQDYTIRVSEMGAQPGIPRKYQQKLPLYTLDTDNLKDKIHLVRLRPDSRQPMWLHSETGEDYFRQMLAEKRRTNSAGAVKWDAGSRANHLFDCEVYNAAAADPLWTPSLMTLAEPILIPIHAHMPKQHEQIINPYTGEVC